MNDTQLLVPTFKRFEVEKEAKEFNLRRDVKIMKLSRELDRMAGRVILKRPKLSKRIKVEADNGPTSKA